MIGFVLYTGFMSNGEYNVFRYKGYTRPLSIFQLRSQARKKFKSIGVKRMKGMLTPVGEGIYLSIGPCGHCMSILMIRRYGTWILFGY